MVERLAQEERSNERATLSEREDAIRVLVIAPSFDIIGGQSVQAARLMERLKSEPSLEISFLPINPRLPGVLRKLQAIKYVRTVVTTLLYLWTLFASAWRCDVLHIFSASYFSFVLAQTPAILIGKLYGKRVILNYHSGEAEDHLRRWRRTAIPTMRLADEIVVPSEYLVEIFARFNLKARAIFNHVETSALKFRERTRLRPVFLSNRNFQSHYNVALVLRAFARLQRSFADARLLVAGDGPERERLESLARDLNLNQVEFVGLVAPTVMPALYDEADIYLNGSEIDNMPLSILEAYASGLPVVTTDAGGIPYILRNEETGLLIPRGDEKAMAACAVRLLEDEDLAARLIKNARAECHRYSWEAVREDWLMLYHQVARKNVRVRGENVLSSEAQAAKH